MEVHWADSNEKERDRIREHMSWSNTQWQNEETFPLLQGHPSLYPSLSFLYLSNQKDGQEARKCWYSQHRTDLKDWMFGIEENVVKRQKNMNISETWNKVKGEQERKRHSKQPWAEGYDPASPLVFLLQLLQKKDVLAQERGGSGERNRGKEKAQPKIALCCCWRITKKILT